MDPVSIAWALLTGTTFGLPLLIILVAALVWLAATPKADPPPLVPRRVWREPSPDQVSMVYWEIASGEISKPLLFVYQRWASGVRAKYGVYPWEIPTRRKKALKKGITRYKELLKLDKQILELYYKAIALEGRTEDSFAGTNIWARRRAKHKEKMKKVIKDIQLEMPELWAY